MKGNFHGEGIFFYFWCVKKLPFQWCWYYTFSIVKKYFDKIHV